MTTQFIALDQIIPPLEGICPVCLARAKPDEWLPYHLIALEDGGCDRRMNTLTVCTRCHRKLNAERLNNNADLRLVAHCFQQYRYGLLYTLYWLRHNRKLGGEVAQHAHDLANNLRAMPSRRAADAEMRRMGAKFYESYEG